MAEVNTLIFNENASISDLNTTIADVHYGEISNEVENQHFSDPTLTDLSCSHKELDYQSNSDSSGPESIESSDSSPASSDDESSDDIFRNNLYEGSKNLIDLTDLLSRPQSSST